MISQVSFFHHSKNPLNLIVLWILSRTSRSSTTLTTMIVVVVVTAVGRSSKYETVDRSVDDTAKIEAAKAAANDVVVSFMMIIYSQTSLWSSE